MDIDERIQALTESVELLTADVRELQTAVRETTAATAKLADAMTGLVAIIGNHERRLQRLEGSPSPSEPGTPS